MCVIRQLISMKFKYETNREEVEKLVQKQYRIWLFFFIGRFLNTSKSYADHAEIVYTTRK